jgi:Na+/H+ antiporter 1
MKQFFCVNSRDLRATLYDFVSIRVYSRLESSQRFQRFSGTETVGRLILLLAAIAALVLANSPLAKAYEQLWQIPLAIRIIDHSFR